MADWGRQLLRRGALEAALALALGYAFLSVIEAFVQIPLDALAQHVVRLGEEQSALVQASYTYLNFNIGGTIILYGQFLAALLTLVAIAAAVFLLRRARERTLGRCPYCLTFVLPGAEVCPGCAYQFLSAEGDDSNDTRR